MYYTKTSISYYIINYFQAEENYCFYSNSLYFPKEKLLFFLKLETRNNKIAGGDKQSPPCVAVP